MNESSLRTLFAEIVKGFTHVKSKNFYIKHLSNLDGADLDESRSLFFEMAKKNKMPTFQERQEYIIKNGLWSVENEKKIKETSEFINTLENNKLHEILPSRIQEYNKTLNDERRKLNILKLQKEKIIGETAEDFASKKVNEVYMRYCLFGDKKLESPLYTEEEYEDLDDIQINDLLKTYTDASSKFSAKSLKKMAISPFFLNIYFLCDDNPFTFWGKPIVDLTYYQIECFGYGRTFKGIIQSSESKPPEDVMNDPDKLLDWHSTNKNAQKILDKSQDKAATSIVGASKEDLKKLNLDGQLIDYAEIAKKKGKSKLSMQEIMEIHGD